MASFPTGIKPLLWRHNGHDSVLNHQPYDCLLNRLFRRRSKKPIKAPRHWPLCGEFAGTGEFPAQMASYAEPFDDVTMPLPEQLLTQLPTPICVIRLQCLNTLRPRQNGRHFADDIFKRIFLKENVKMSEFRLKFHWSLFIRVQLTIFQHCFR